MKKFLSLLLVTVLTVTTGFSGVKAEEVELDVNSEQVLSLYDNLSFFENVLGVGNMDGYLFRKDSYTVDDLSNEAKILIGSYQSLFNTEIGSFSIEFTSEEMATYIGSVLGAGIEYVDEAPATGGCGLTPLKYENGKYTIASGCGGLGYPFYSSELLKAVKTENTIEIYENVIYVKPLIAPNSLEDYEIYTPDKANLIATIDDYDSIESYLEKGYVYKYTFTYDSATNNYYFTSIQKVDYKFDETKKTTTEETNAVEESVVENPNTSVTVGISVLGISVIALIVMRKRNKFNKV